MTSELKFIGAFLKEVGKNDASRVIFYLIFFSFKTLQKNPPKHYYIMENL